MKSALEAGDISLRDFVNQGLRAGVARSELAQTLRMKLAQQSSEIEQDTAAVAGACRSLRLVLLSDTHGKHREIDVPSGDVIIHAGDFTNYGRVEDAVDFNAWLGELPHRHKLVVVGNHEKHAVWSTDTAKILTHATFLRDDVAIVPARADGAPPLRVYGTDFFWPNERHAPLASIPQGAVDVVVAHGPAAGFVDGGVGCPLLLEQVERIRPSLVVSGHIHEAHGIASGSCDALRTTTFVNAANAPGRNRQGRGHRAWPAIVVDV